MNDSRKFDAAIVGGGISGLMSGVRLRELGLRVAVLEKGDQERYLCNSRYTGGVFHIGLHSVNEEEDILVDAINQYTHGFADPGIARVVAAGARNAVQWLRSKGIKFVKGGGAGWRDTVLAPPPMMKPGLQWEGRGGDVMVRTLGGVLKESGGALLLGTRALRLRMDDDRCVGLEAEQGAQRTIVHADTVVLCDGGFQANHALLREFITQAPEKLKQRNAGVGNGDALQMAREVGARLIGMENFYGHVLCQDAMHSDQLWPTPKLDEVCMAAIVIDGAGRRFADEGLGGVYMTNSIAHLPDPLSAAVVYDQAIWTGAARDSIIPPNPNLVSAGATILKASDLAGLATQLGLSQGVLEATVTQYNSAIDSGRTAALDPGRSISKHKPQPIRQAPFYAVRLCAGITSTMGGVAIDSVGRVLNEQDKPIAGLYAAGCTAGGLEGGPFAGYVGQLAYSSSMALRVANHIASSRRE